MSDQHDHDGDHQPEPEAPKPADALYVPATLAGTGTIYDKLPRLTAIARPLLGLKPGDPNPVVTPAEQQGDDYLFFVRKTTGDSKMFPSGHPRAGQERHDWTDGPDGIRLGHSRS